MRSHGTPTGTRTLQAWPLAAALVVASGWAPAHAAVIGATRQDTPTIAGALPAYLFDSGGTPTGTVGPPDATSRIQDIAFDPLTGDLLALVNDNDLDGKVYNLSQDTSFSVGASVTLDNGGNIAVRNDGTIAVTRQDQPAISGALPVLLFDTGGNSLGTVGPPDATSRIQDIAFDPTSGALFALVNDNTPSGRVYNLTDDTSFSVGASVTLGGGGNIAIDGNGTIAVTRQDSQAISGALPVLLFDTDGNSLGTIGPPDTTSRIQDIAFDLATGDLFALVNSNDPDGVIYNLTQDTGFSFGASVRLAGGGNIALAPPPPAAAPEPSTVALLMLAGLAGLGRRGRGRSRARPAADGRGERS